ncbi:hypothetical protein [Desulfurivibrio alkaliphilus]|uniref:Uncharacterized protein n=1 Tax=Desulfurivibrio alkaliphilus (strain DSM 19089 / UNIQEM U267 / AHT2) TaxID=589865 RepID=D6Z6E2_DESAT|nr:hypothetical protein [Desulfurivibrio alkaliphilus]ADH86907.1 hypothetical protein DaAHT2_2242 [Desulfurivibrio alkaliphilus AHT 2]
MKPVFALYFPDILPPLAAVAGLAPLPFPLHSLRCWPDDQPPAPWSSLVAGGRLQPVTSFDPGPDSRRLQNLLRELEGRRGEDALLFARGLAAEFSARREETAPELIGPLLGQSRDRASDRQREELWQALLLLKLAENLERGEMEIEAELQAFETRRAALFRKLNGKDQEEAKGDAPAEPPPKTADSLAPPRPWRHAGRLLRAWHRLLQHSAVCPEMLLSADAEAWSLMQEFAENHHYSYQPLPTLLLPTPATDPAAPNDPIAPTGQGQEVGRQLLTALQQAAKEGNSGSAVAAVEEWNRQIAAEEQNHPADHPPARHAVELLFFPATPLTRLLADYHRSTPAAPAEPGTPAGGLLALYRPAGRQ